MKNALKNYFFLSKLCFYFFFLSVAHTSSEKLGGVCRREREKLKEKQMMEEMKVFNYAFLIS